MAGDAGFVFVGLVPDCGKGRPEMARPASPCVPRVTLFRLKSGIRRDATPPCRRGQTRCRVDACFSLIDGSPLRESGAGKNRPFPLTCRACRRISGVSHRKPVRTRPSLSVAAKAAPARQGEKNVRPVSRRQTARHAPGKTGRGSQAAHFSQSAIRR